MEVEDPISAKFRTIIEGLMIKTTSDIVKVFVDVMLETRMEISRSWREIDDLKQELEQREKQRAESSFRSQTSQVTFKTEADDVMVSQRSPMILESTESRVSYFPYTLQHCTLNWIYKVAVFSFNFEGAYVC